jgi:hypothetical protein
MSRPGRDSRHGHRLNGDRYGEWTSGWVDKGVLARNDSVLEDCQVQVSRTAHIPAIAVRSPSPSSEGCDAGPSGAPGNRAQREVRACKDRLVCGSTDLEERVYPTVLPIPYSFRDEEDTVRAHLRAGCPVQLIGPTMVDKTKMASQSSRRIWLR